MDISRFFFSINENKNFFIKASNDGKTWIILKRHLNDSSLNSNFGKNYNFLLKILYFYLATASWPIYNCNQAYRNFRILQTGHNSSNNNFLYHFIFNIFLFFYFFIIRSICGIEIYGDLYEKDVLDGYNSP